MICLKADQPGRWNKLISNSGFSNCCIPLFRLIKHPDQFFVFLKIVLILIMEERIQNNSDFSRLLHDQQERLKELACINRTTSILKEGKPIEESLHQIALLLPAAWQYPEYTVARINSWKRNLNLRIFTKQTGKCPGFSTIDGEEVNRDFLYHTIQE